MKRILFVSSLTSVGGHEALWLRTAESALHKGYEVGVCVFNTEIAKMKLKEMLKDPDFCVFYKKPNGLLKQAFNRFVPARFRFVEINRRALKWKPDITLFTNGSNMPLGLDITLFARKGIRYCMVGHSENALYWADDKTNKLLISNFEHSVANYFVSQSMLDLARLQVGRDIANAKVIRNPYNVKYDTKLPYPQDETLRLACVGSYNFEEKGQDILMEVMAMSKWRARNIVINFYGSGIHKERIQNLITLFNLQEKVHIRGFCSTIDIWKENHALIMPSRHEGLPMAIVEAMLCQRLPIVTDVGGNGEVILDNENGFISPAARAKYVDEALERAWNRRDEWELIGRKAGEYIRKLVPEEPEDIFLDEVMSNLPNKNYS